MNSLLAINPIARSLVVAGVASALVACASSPSVESAAGSVAPAAAAAGGASAASGIISSLIGAVPGLSPQHASLAAGALFALAKSKLAADQFAKLGQAVPGIDALIAGALQAGLPSQPASLASITPALSQAGIGPDIVDQLIPALGSAVSKAGGQDLANTLLAVLK